VRRIAEALIRALWVAPADEPDECLSSPRHELPPDDEERVAAAALELLNVKWRTEH